MNDFQNRIVDLRRQQDAVAGRIKAALVAGDDTAPIRAEAAELTHRIAEMEQLIADANARRHAASQEAISAAATVIATDAVAGINTTLARLAAPEHL